MELVSGEKDTTTQKVPEGNDEVKTKKIRELFKNSSNKAPSEYFSSEYEGVDYGDKEYPPGNWVFPTLYNVMSTGQVTAWRIGFNITFSSMVWVYGTHLGDKTQVFYKEIKSNVLNKTVSAKAWQDAKAKFKNMMFKGYNEDLSKSSKISVGSTGFPLPMLANVYKPPTFDTTKGKLKAGNITKFPVALQAKFDGVRNMARLNGEDEDDESGGVEMVSRELRKRNFFTKMRKELKIFLDMLPENTVLDGEFFSTGKEFQRITSIVSAKTSPHPEENLIRFYIFDIFNTREKWPSEDRIRILRETFEKYVEMGGKNEQFLLVNTIIANDHDEIVKNFRSFIDQGYEGAMIRHYSFGEKSGPVWDKSLYSHTRKNNLLKVKDFQEVEVKIISVRSADGRERGSAVFDYEDPTTGVKGTVRPAATLEDRRKWYQNPQLVLGRLYTIRYQNKTEDGAFRFPTGKGFRDEA